MSDQSTLTLSSLAFAIAVGLGSAPTVSAQSNASSTSALEEVTVTARRRSESLQDVPIAVTAYSGDALEKIGAIDITAIGQTTPNMTLEVSRGTNTTLTAFIRGVGQQDPVPGFEAGVGIYIDDVYLNRPQAAVLDIFDVERIEVLRGPQGTLYGRNTIGGAIKYVTKRLSDEPTAKIRGTVGTDGQAELVFTGSTAISDVFRVGGSIASLNREGFGENLNNGRDNYNKDILAGRLSAEWDATESFLLRLSADYIQDDSDPRQGHRLTVGNLSGAPVLSDVFDTRAGLDNPRQEVESRGVSLLAQWDINENWTLKNILAYRDDETRTPIDFDSLPSADLDVPAIYENDQLSEELQLLYSGERWNGVIGAYLLDANAFTAFDVILGNTGAVIGLPGLNAFTLGDVDTDTWSLFADFTFDINDQWSVAFGGRYTSDERTSRVLRQTLIGGTSDFFGGTAIPIATTSDFNGSEEFNEFVPRMSVAFKPNENNNFYLSYSEGFKGGSFDPRGQTSAAPDLDGDGDIDSDDVFNFMQFEPEFVETVELGWKTSAWDGRLKSALAIFFSDYTDVQIPGSVGVDTDGDGVTDSFIGITSNAADADISGLEWEGQVFLAESWLTGGDSLSAAWTLGYIDAQFNEFIDAFGVDVADQRVFQNTPDLTGSATINYSFPLDLLGNSGELSIINTFSHRDEASQFEVPNPFLDQDTFTLWDMSVVWEDDAGHWRAGIHGKNLFDEEYKVAGYFFPTLGLEGNITAFYGNPLTVSGTVEYRF